MISKTGYNIKIPKFNRKNWSEGHLHLSLFINRSVAKKFPTRRFLRTVDSSVRNPGEVEYDKQNRLQRQKSQAWPKNWCEGHLQLSLFINRSVTKKFPIETLSEMIDSSVRSLGKSNMISRPGYNVKKPKLGRKIWSEDRITFYVTVYKSVHNKKVPN